MLRDIVDGYIITRQNLTENSVYEKPANVNNIGETGL